MGLSCCKRQQQQDEEISGFSKPQESSLLSPSSGVYFDNVSLSLPMYGRESSVPRRCQVRSTPANTLSLPAFALSLPAFDEESSVFFKRLESPLSLSSEPFPDTEPSEHSPDTAPSEHSPDTAPSEHSPDTEPSEHSPDTEPSEPFPDTEPSEPFPDTEPLSLPMYDRTTLPIRSRESSGPRRYRTTFPIKNTSNTRRDRKQHFLLGDKEPSGFPESLSLPAPASEPSPDTEHEEPSGFFKPSADYLKNLSSEPSPDTERRETSVLRRCQARSTPANIASEPSPDTERRETSVLRRSPEHDSPTDDIDEDILFRRTLYRLDDIDEDFLYRSPLQTLYRFDRQLELERKNRQLELECENRQLELECENRQLELERLHRQLELECKNRQLELECKNEEPSVFFKHRKLELERKNRQLELECKNRQLELERKKRKLELERKMHLFDLKTACEQNRYETLCSILPSIEDANDLGNCLTEYPLTELCKQAVVFEIKRRLEDEENSNGNYRIEPVFNDAEEVVFLVYGQSVVREREKQFAGMKVLFRNPKQVNSEAIRIANSTEMRTLNTKNIKGTDYAEKAIQVLGSQLMKSHSNINALGISHLRSRKGGLELHPAEKALVVIYCSSKTLRPIQEEKFPREIVIDDITVLTDVREGFFEMAPRTYSAIPSSHFHPKLKMGCECEVDDNGQSRGGTIGPFVTLHSKKDGDLNGFLTCAHVAYGFEDGSDSYRYDEVNTPTQFQVNQPPVDNFPNPPPSSTFDPKCGKTYRGTFGHEVEGVTVDAAVISVQPDRMPSGGEFAILRPKQLRETGFSTFPVYDSAECVDRSTEIMNEEIVKFGAMTHVTKGVFVSLVHVREPISLGITGATGLQERRFEMKGQLEISSFTANERFMALGDSGSGVFVKRSDDLRCLGLGIGCMTNGSGVVTPIKPILEELGVELKSFTEPMDDSK